MRYNEKLVAVTAFIQENFVDAEDLVATLNLSIEDIIKHFPDVLVSNYNKFFDDDNTKEETTEDFDAYTRLGETWQTDEEEDY